MNHLPGFTPYFGPSKNSSLHVQARAPPPHGLLSTPGLGLTMCVMAQAGIPRWGETGVAGEGELMF